ncbi:MFS transporter [Amycolatopsis sp. NPDC026612]|uniref:MFS transporter n=1 Tax=Amycolatopsis sp. NPDC026612 TaxID=3155466 RepID=UPI003401EFD7
MATKWWTLIAVVVGVFMLLLDTTIVNTALPSIQRDFSASLGSLQWIVDAYALVLAAALLIGGSLADRFGRRLLYTVGVGVFTGGSLLCGLATGPGFLIGSRAVQGVGGAIMFATALALLGDAFRGKDRGTAFGIYGAVTGIAIAIGPMTGGLITISTSWRWVFLLNVPIGLVVALITVAKVGESRNPAASRLDWFGFVTFGGALAALIYGLISSGDGWGKPNVVVSLGLAAVLLTAFVVSQFRQDRPMLTTADFRKPAFNGAMFASFAVAGSMFALILYIVLYLQNQLGYNAFEGGLRTTPITLGVFLSSTLAGRLTTVLPVRAMIAGGFGLVGIGLLLMRGLTADSTWTHLIPGMICCGIGAGFVNVPLVSTVVRVVGPARAGMSGGLNNTLRQVGLATGIALYGSLFAASLRSGTLTALRSTPFAGDAERISAGVSAGARPGAVPPEVATAIRTGFTGALDQVLLIGALLAIAGCVLSAVLIRAKDFVPMGPPPGTAPKPSGVKPEAQPA